MVRLHWFRCEEVECGLAASFAGLLPSFMMLENVLGPKDSLGESWVSSGLEHHWAGQHIHPLEVGRDLRWGWRSVEARWYSREYFDTTSS